MDFVNFLTLFLIIYSLISDERCSDPYKTYYFLKKHDEVFQMDINSLNRLKLLAEISTNLQKMHYFRQFKEHNSGRKKINKTKDPFFSSTPWALFEAFIFVFDKCQNSFSWGTPFGPCWSAKYLNFGGESCKIRILSRSIQEISKKSGFNFLIELRTKFVWSHGL